MHLVAAGSLLTCAALAQVPPRSAIASVIANLAPSEGLWLVDRSGSCTAITGLGTSGSAGYGVNAVQLDPLDDRIWLGGINSNGNTAGQVNSVMLSGSTVTSFVQHGTTGFASSIAALTFDDNGNPVAATGTSTSGGVVLIPRSGGVGTVLATIGTTQTHNAICRDPAGNLYIGMFGSGEVHKMIKNPDCTYQPPVLLGVVPITSVSGIEWCPGTPDQVFVTTFGVAGNALFKLPATGGAAVVASATVGSLNAAEYDRAVGDFWSVTAGIDPDNVSTITKAGVETIVCGLQGGSVGSPSGIDTSDCADAETNLLPQCVRPGQQITFEFGTCCQPGDAAGVFMVSPAVVPLLIGTAGANGRLSGSFPLVVPGGIAPGSFTFISACLDQSGQLTVGRPTPWPQ
ncbi:MAG: hypothetical protein R3F56_07980 [Planctomycetota bacterium]